MKCRSNGREDGHNAETAAAGGDDALIMSGINVVQMDTSSAHAAVGFGAGPEILKSLPFHKVEQCAVERGWSMQTALTAAAPLTGK